MSNLVAGLEIGAAVLVPLVREIVALMDAGATEEEATRKALERLAAQPDLEAVLPKVRARIAAARAPSSPPGVVLEEVDRKALGALLRDTQLAPHLSMEARAAIRRAAAIALPTPDPT